jgi:hypothetical protein
VLGHGPTCGVRKQVQLLLKEKLKKAISVANEMREKNFPRKRLLGKRT